MDEYQFHVLLSKKYRQALGEAVKELPDLSRFDISPVILFTMLNDLACYIECMSDDAEAFEHNLGLAFMNLEKISRERFKKYKVNKPTDIKFKYD